MKQLIPIFLVLVHATSGWSQEVIELNDALIKALNNNHQIKVLRYQQAIAENNVNLGQAGLLPTVSLGGSYGANVQNTDLEFAGNLPPVNVQGAQSATLNANATVNYTLFNGFTGRRNYERLGINKLAVDENSRAAIEGTLIQVASAYYALSQAQDLEKISLERLNISKERYERMRIANELGIALRNELLASRVDLTTDSSALLNARLQKNQASRNLCQLIGIAPSIELKLAELEFELFEWTEEQLLSEALKNNALLRNRELQKQLAEKDQQLAQSSYFPSVAIAGGYGFTNQQNEAGIILGNTASGWNGSIGISYTLFNGFRNTNSRQNQALVLAQREVELEEQKLQLQTEIANALNAFEQSIMVLNFENQNLAASELNLSRSKELFEQGNITSTQFREAQLALSNAQLRIANAKVAVKLNELSILSLTGQILPSN
jgi:outer membrane protein